MVVVSQGKLEEDAWVAHPPVLVSRELEHRDGQGPRGGWSTALVHLRKRRHPPALWVCEMLEGSPQKYRFYVSYVAVVRSSKFFMNI